MRAECKDCYYCPERLGVWFQVFLPPKSKICEELFPDAAHICAEFMADTHKPATSPAHASKDGFLKRDLNQHHTLKGVQ